MTVGRQPTHATAILAVAFCWILTPVAHGQSVGLTESARVAKCMALARGDPDIGHKAALAWRADGGGSDARHCAAVALLGLGQYSEAARILRTLAEGAPAKRPEFRLDLLSQSANAWLIAGKPMIAYEVQTEALEARPDDVELLIDRSISLASSQKYWRAIDDLNRALDIDPERVDALIFRANAYRRLDTPELAEEDIARAIAIAPHHPEALLERGNIRHLKGDRNGARTDWLKVIETSPGAPVAAAARLNLDRMKF
jgi:tetratricopeptide (TPR) repeat protein